jgi:hypothetical protein
VVLARLIDTFKLVALTTIKLGKPASRSRKTLDEDHHTLESASDTSPFQNIETFRLFNVSQIYTAKGKLDKFASATYVVRILSPQADVKTIYTA